MRLDLVGEFEKAVAAARAKNGTGATADEIIPGVPKGTTEVPLSDDEALSLKDRLARVDAFDDAALSAALKSLTPGQLLWIHNENRRRKHVPAASSRSAPTEHAASILVHPYDTAIETLRGKHLSRRGDRGTPASVVVKNTITGGAGGARFVPTRRPGISVPQRQPRLASQFSSQQTAANLIYYTRIVRGSNASPLSEGAAAGDVAPTFSQAQTKRSRISGEIQVSREQWADASNDLGRGAFLEEAAAAARDAALVTQIEASDNHTAHVASTMASLFNMVGIIKKAVHAIKGVTDWAAAHGDTIEAFVDAIEAGAVEYGTLVGYRADGVLMVRGVPVFAVDSISAGAVLGGDSTGIELRDDENVLIQGFEQDRTNVSAGLVTLVASQFVASLHFDAALTHIVTPGA